MKLLKIISKEVKECEASEPVVPFAAGVTLDGVTRTSPWP